MASDLNRSLDEILAMHACGNQGGGKASAATQNADISTINTSTKRQGVPTGPSGKAVSTKIIISNLVWLPILLSHDAIFSNSFLTAVRCLGADD